jgi:transcription elongation factor GreB
VVKALSEAAAEGDRSENAEYIYRKKQLGEIDRRVRYLGKRLESLKVAEDRPSDPARLFRCAYRTRERRHREIVRYRIVGPTSTMPRSATSAGLAAGSGCAAQAR